MLRTLWVLGGLGVAAAPGALTACGGSGGATSSAPTSAPPPGPTAPPGPTPPPGPAPPPGPTPGPTPAPTPAPAGFPRLGAHNLAFARQNVSVPQLTTPLTTSASGSMLLACVGRGNVTAHAAPTDNKGNTFVQIGSAQRYTRYPSSGTALYACLPATGGSGHNVTASKPALDETTLSVVEVQGGGVIQDVRWSEVLAPAALTSASVVTTGPALIVAWWWGDADENNAKTAEPNNGFTVIDSVLFSGELVQCAVATRRVDAAGSYNVTWTATPLQGAQLWIAAVQV